MILFNDSLTNRYNTLERNIKSKSNSFYDSYLDLLEATIKYILDENNLEYDDSRTCGYIVREDNIKSFFKNELKLDSYTFDKIPDYIKKCNDHKHKKEKWLSIESVINYLKIYFDLVNYYLNYIMDEADDSDGDIMEVLDNIERYKGIIEYKYRKYLDDKYINLLNKKLNLVERKIKAKLIYKQLDLEEKEEVRGKSR